jgi:hypothetical protein
MMEMCDFKAIFGMCRSVGSKALHDFHAIMQDTW